MTKVIISKRVSTGCPNIDDTTEEVILHEKISRKHGIKFVYSRLRFRENQY